MIVFCFDVPNARGLVSGNGLIRLHKKVTNLPLFFGKAVMRYSGSEEQQSSSFSRNTTTIYKYEFTIALHLVLLLLFPRIFLKSQRILYFFHIMYCVRMQTFPAPSIKRFLHSLEGLVNQTLLVLLRAKHLVVFMKKVPTSLLFLAKRS